MIANNARARRHRARAAARRQEARITTVQAMRPDNSRKSKVRYSGSGDNGYGSSWARSANYKTAATVDARWSA